MLLLIPYDLLYIFFMLCRGMLCLCHGVCSSALQNRLMVLHAFDRALSGEFLPADTDADADVDSIGLGKQRTAWGRLAAGSKQQHDSRNTMYDYEPEGDGHDTIFDDSVSH